MRTPKKRKMIKRNPEARELARNPLFRTKIMPGLKQIAEKNDPWNRRRKHKTAADDDSKILVNF